MIHHPHYLEVPWDIHWEQEAAGRHRHLWWLIAGVALVAIFLIGVGVTGGTLE